MLGILANWEQPCPKQFQYKNPLSCKHTPLLNYSPAFGQIVFTFMVQVSLLPTKDSLACARWQKKPSTGNTSMLLNHLEVRTYIYHLFFNSIYLICQYTSKTKTKYWLEYLFTKIEVVLHTRIKQDYLTKLVGSNVVAYVTSNK